MNIIFDFDGTLHETMYIYGPAFRKSLEYLVGNNYIEAREISDQEISSWLGYTAVEMWAKFGPDLPEEVRNKSSQIVGAEMKALIEIGKSKLYDGALEMLATLKQKGHKLFFLSNCKESYMEANRKNFDLDKYFDKMYAAEAYGWQPKTEIFKLIKEEFPGDFVMVGDRKHDLEIGLVHKIPTIGCAYGYGTEEELKMATYVAKSPMEIPEIIKKISDK